MLMSLLCTSETENEYIINNQLKINVEDKYGCFWHIYLSLNFFYSFYMSNIQKALKIHLSCLIIYYSI